MKKRGELGVFGLVNANVRELTKQQQQRYNSVYCGICRRIRHSGGQLCRLGLSYDMAFLALLHMSLYEPEETAGNRACALHPFSPKAWVDNEYIGYAADMNVALGYYNAMDDWLDDGNPAAKFMADRFGKNLDAIRNRYPRQCQAMETCIARLGELERENCDNPDTVANCFGALMGELMVYREDLWADVLRQLGMALGRFIYLGDAALDYQKDKRTQKYNPYLAMGAQDSLRWREYLVLSMASCTQAFEKLPLVQDKAILDNILYSGVWSGFARLWKKEAQTE